MNTTKSLYTVAAVMALSLASAGAAFAQEATPDTWTQIATHKSRAEVRAELAQARASGLTKAWSAGYIEKIASTQPREAVKAQTRQAIASGEQRAINAEVYTFRPLLPVRVAARW